MNFARVFIFSFFISSIFSHITINIDPDDLESVADFFVSFIEQYQQQQHFLQLPSTNSAFFKIMKKSFCKIVNLFGIMMTLVGASFITSIIEFNSDVLYEKSINFENQKPNGNVSDECVIDYGCRDNLCWRKCFSRERDADLWCYTSSNPIGRSYQRCNSTFDCSSCFECIETCHKWVNDFFFAWFCFLFLLIRNIRFFYSIFFSDIFHNFFIEKQMNNTINII